MSETTVRHKLPYILAAQAQKHVTHNEALRLLDGLVNLHILAFDLDTSPITPLQGNCYTVGNNPTGDWAQHASSIAYYIDGSWMFIEPFKGLRAFDETNNRLVHFDGNAWQSIASDPDKLPRLGINTSADDTNLLAVKSDAVLISTNDEATTPSGDVRLTLNKTASNDTASLIFQTGYSARAEMGTTGSDGFDVKVSADGANWKTAISIDEVTAEVSLPFTYNKAPGVLNLFSDSGRFAGVSNSSIVFSDTFQIPSWASFLNGASMSEHGKFYRNSLTYGGTAPVLDADIEQLMESLMDVGRRRYFPEFFVAKIIAGTSTGSSKTYSDNISRHTQLYAQGYLLPVQTSFSYYVKVKTGDIGLTGGNATKIYIDGVEQGISPLILADSIWHHVTIQEDYPVQESQRYSYSTIRFYMRSGDESIIAFPAMVAGIHHFDTKTGLLPNVGEW